MKRTLLILTALIPLLFSCQNRHRQATPAGAEGEPADTARTDRPATPAADTPAVDKPGPAKHGGTFWLGADISWETGMEKRGEKLYNFTGSEEWECTALMKDLGLNAVRLRVWVDPWGGDCDKNDLLAKCLKAKQNGMAIMVNFHYSDSWADPQKQPVPKAWKGHSFEQMKEDLKAHTVEVLTLLKDNGIEPKWAQIGNETTHGLLWSFKSGRGTMGATAREYEDTVGHIDFAPEQYAGFIQAGHDAVKSVFPRCITIVHLDDGWNPAIYDKNLGILRRYHVKYDMVGMSLYPYWAREKGRNDADGIITDCIANIRNVYDKFGKESMIVETGFEVDEAHPEILAEGRRQLERIIREAKDNTGGHCKGVFYWEPECRPGQYRLGAFSSEGRPTEIMKAFRAE